MITSERKPRHAAALSPTKVLTVAQMRALEDDCFNQGLARAALMEQAIQGLAATIIERWPRQQHRNVVVLVGPGGNGADGLGLARALQLAGYRTHAACVADRAGQNDLWEAQHQFAQHCGVTLLPPRTAQDTTGLALLCAEADVLIDAIWGLGFSADRSMNLATLFSDIEKALRQRRTMSEPHLRHHPVVVAIDGPSGLELDGRTAADEVVALRAQETLTLGHWKPALVDDAYAPWVGRVTCVPFATPGPQHSSASMVSVSRTLEDLKHHLDSLPQVCHKYRRGTVWVAAGSARYPGAARLAIAGALAARPGYVRWLSDHDGFLPDLPASVVPVMQVGPHGSVDFAQDTGSTRDHPASGLFGPGRTCYTEHELAFIRNWPGPIVLDAGALENPTVLSLFPYPYAASLSAPRILTPHRGEFEKLWKVWSAQKTGRMSADAQTPDQPDSPQHHRLNLMERLQLMASNWNVTILLKGAATLIASPEGEVQVFYAPNNDLATAGTGDVLSGFLAALLARGAPATLAASSSVVLQSLAAKSLGNDALVKHPAAHQALDEGTCYPTALARAMALRLRQNSILQNQ
jgi:hydroxyethylthiazole kinase-like uncharacterized protein yjeF